MDDVVKKSDVRELLKTASYPASLDDLISEAESNGADEGDLDLIKELPNVDYQSWEEVEEALGEPEEEEEED
jgi:hypothetical protein